MIEQRCRLQPVDEWARVAANRRHMAAHGGGVYHEPHCAAEPIIRCSLIKHRSWHALGPAAGVGCKGCALAPAEQRATMAAAASGSWSMQVCVVKIGPAAVARQPAPLKLVPLLFRCSGRCCSGPAVRHGTLGGPPAAARQRRWRTSAASACRRQRRPLPPGALPAPAAAWHPAA